MLLQDLDGFGLEEEVSEFGEAAPTEKPADNFGMPEDGYDYSKHVRTIGDGVFVPREAARSEASFARSGVTGLSRISRASLASKQGEIMLRGVADEVCQRPQTRAFARAFDPPPEFRRPRAEPLQSQPLQSHDVTGASKRLRAVARTHVRWLGTVCELSTSALTRALRQAFASTEELAVSVGNTVGAETAGEDENLAAIEEMDEDVRAALFSDEVLEECEEPDDDFVLKASDFRETELVALPARPPKRGVYAVPEEVDEGEEGELRIDSDGAAYPLSSYKEEYGEDWQWHWSRASRAPKDAQEGAVPSAGPAAAGSTSVDGEETEEARRKRERRAEAFRLFSGGDDEEDEDEQQSVVSEQPSVVSSRGRSGGRSGVARAPGRLLDRQFARLMSEYEEDEIGELDQVRAIEMWRYQVRPNKERERCSRVRVLRPCLEAASPVPRGCSARA